MRLMVSAVTPAFRSSTKRAIPRAVSTVRAIWRRVTEPGIDIKARRIGSIILGFVSQSLRSRKPSICEIASMGSELTNPVVAKSKDVACRRTWPIDVKAIVATATSDACRHSSTRNFTKLSPRAFRYQPFPEASASPTSLSVPARTLSWPPTGRMSRYPDLGESTMRAVRAGYPSMISSVAAPCNFIAATVWTGMRVPLKTGSPPTKPFSLWMILSACISASPRSAKCSFALATSTIR